MTVAVILLCVLLMYFSAYTVAVQRTIRTLGLFDRGESDRSNSTHSQCVILLGMCLTKLNAAFLLGLAVYLITSRASTWYYGVAIVALCWVGSLFIGSVPHLRPGSAQIIAILVAELERRREWYRSARDAARLQAVEELLARIRSIPGMHLDTR